MATGIVTALGLRSGPLTARIGRGWQVVLCLSMISNFWSWGASTPPVVPILVFSAGMLWFVAVISFRPAPDAPGRVVPSRSLLDNPSYQAGLMGAIVAVALVVAVRQTPSAVAGVGPGVTSGSPIADMSGMDGMSTMDGMSGMSGPSGMPLSAAPGTGWLRVVSLVLAVALVAAATLLGTAQVIADRRRPRVARTSPRLFSAVATYVMSLGLAGAFLLMA